MASIKADVLASDTFQWRSNYVHDLYDLIVRLWRTTHDFRLQPVWQQRALSSICPLSKKFNWFSLDLLLKYFLIKTFWAVKLFSSQKLSSPNFVRMIKICILSACLSGSGAGSLNLDTNKLEGLFVCLLSGRSIRVLSLRLEDVWSGLCYTVSIKWSSSCCQQLAESIKFFPSLWPTE